MQKLIIQSQFMGVKPCEIELKKFLLLIGEQASGKSTIAKLIYFFQTLPDSIVQNSLLAAARGERFDFPRHIKLVTRDKFYETFGSTFHHATNFEIIFHYDNGETIRIFRDKRDKKAYSEFSQKLEDSLENAVSGFFQKRSRNVLLERVDEILQRQDFLKSIARCFARENVEFNYLIAGRNTVVGYASIFDDCVKREIDKIIESQAKRQSADSSRRVGNERLLLDFVNQSEENRLFFKNNGGSFETAAKALEQRPTLSKLAEIFAAIIKGKYDNDSYGEIIRINSLERVYLKDASSGQQEVLRVLQSIFLAVGSPNRKEFFVIEEPEAHLYPLAQKELMNAFAVFLNTIPQGKLIVTTHSPYILACINILLFAHYVSNEIGQTNGTLATVPRAYWLDPSFFSAYSLGQSDNYCQNIKDSETGLIDQNYLDTISEHLGMQYQQLYNLLTAQVS